MLYIAICECGSAAMNLARFDQLIETDQRIAYGNGKAILSWLALKKDQQTCCLARTGVKNHTDL